MAADINKNSDPGKDEAGAAVKVGSGSVATRGRRLRVPVVTKRALFIILVVVVVAAGVFLVLKENSHVGEKVYAQAAGHKIYKKDLQGMQVVGGKKTGVSDHAAATVLADKYLSEAMAKQQGIKVTQDDIVAAYGKGITSQKKTDPYGYQNLVNQLYFSDLNEHSVGVYAGKLIVANFSRNVPYQSALLPQQKAENPNLGNPAAIAKDKKYAQTFINNLYDQIKSKKITFDQAMQKEHNDPVVGEKAYGTQQHSGSFNGPIGQIGLLSAKSIRSKVTSMKAGELSTPFVVRVSNSINDPNSTAESYYLIVRMDSISGGKGGKTFDQELAQAKKQLGYKVNV